MSYPMSLTVCLMTPPSYRGVEGAGWVSRIVSFSRKGTANNFPSYVFPKSIQSIQFNIVTMGALTVCLLSSVADPDPDPCVCGPPRSRSIRTRYRCSSGSGSGLRLRLRILLSSSKNSKQNLDFYCFVTSLGIFIFEI
jgi:hypothetical protein